MFCSLYTAFIYIACWLHGQCWWCVMVLIVVVQDPGLLFVQLPSILPKRGDWIGPNLGGSSLPHQAIYRVVLCHFCSFLSVCLQSSRSTSGKCVAGEFLVSGLIFFCQCFSSEIHCSLASLWSALLLARLSMS